VEEEEEELMGEGVDETRCPPVEKKE